MRKRVRAFHESRGSTPDGFEAVFARPADELAAINARLDAGLSPSVLHALRYDWVTPQASDTIRAALAAARGRYPPDSRDLKETPVGRAKRHLYKLDPVSISNALATATTYSGAADVYMKTVGAIRESATLTGAMALRYAVPEPTVRALFRACSGPYSAAHAALAAHAEVYGETVGQLKSTVGTGRGLGIAAGVAGKAAVGALGAFTGGAGAYVGFKMAKAARTWAQDTFYGSQLGPVVGRTKTSHAAFYSSFEAAAEESRTALEAVLTVLYGGMLLRLEADLHGYGKELDTVDWKTGVITSRLRPEAAGEFVAWAHGAVGHVGSLISSGDLPGAVAAADAALKYVASDDALARMVSEETGESYMVAFARLRAEALTALADPLWEGGDWFGAAGLYLRLIEGCPVGWDEGWEPGGEPPTLTRAGWRLSLAATSPLAPPDLRRSEAALPEYVAQLQHRVSERPDLAYVGEGAEGPYGLVALMVAEFFRDAAHGKSREFGRRVVGGGWSYTFPWPEGLDRDYTTSVSLMGEPPEGLSGGFATRVRRGWRGEVRGRVTTVALVALGTVAALAAAAYFLMV